MRSGSSSAPKAFKISFIQDRTICVEWYRAPHEFLTVVVVSSPMAILRIFGKKIMKE